MLKNVQILSRILIIVQSCLNTKSVVSPNSWEDGLCLKNCASHNFIQFRVCQKSWEDGLHTTSANFYIKKKCTSQERKIQNNHSQSDLIWPDSSLKCKKSNFKGRFVETLIFIFRKTMQNKVIIFLLLNTWNTSRFYRSFRFVNVKKINARFAQ
jgi:hypothetical protein